MTNEKNFKDIFFDWGLPIILSVIAVLFIQHFLFFMVKIPSASMSPTIEAKDRLFVTRIHNISKIKRGEILVFNSKELNEKLIKRVIGLPGDKVDIDSSGYLYINCEKINEDYIKYPGGKNNISFDIPKNKFLMLGDNRDASLDSRYWINPYIDGKDIEAKAQFRIYPFNKVGFLK